MRERTRVVAAIDRQLALEQEFEDQVGLAELAEEESDQETLAEAERAIQRLRERLARLQLESLLSGEADGNDCFLEIHAGAGGTESQDWAAMLLRMYTRWAEAHGYKLDWILDESPGEEAGLKSASIHIKVVGANAYGWLKTESRRASSGADLAFRQPTSRRHTSFASVWVYPVIDDSIEIDIEDKDLQDRYLPCLRRRRPARQQDRFSAVRITHLPTGIVVQCQNDRSQHRNRAQAMAMLRARLYELELQKREEAAKGRGRTPRSDIGWGHQIRSYVLQPYQMVKDLRTGVEKGNAQGVLDGDIDGFLEAALAHGVGGDDEQAPKD